MGFGLRRPEMLQFEKPKREPLSDSAICFQATLPLAFVEAEPYTKLDGDRNRETLRSEGVNRVDPWKRHGCVVYKTRVREESLGGSMDPLASSENQENQENLENPVQEQSFRDNASHDNASAPLTSGQIQNAWLAVCNQAVKGLEVASERLKVGFHNVLNQQKGYSVNGLHRLSDALHEAVSSLSQQNDRTMAEYINSLRVQVDKATHYLENKQSNEVLTHLNAAIRKQAGLFVGSMFVTGLVVTRLLHSLEKSNSSKPTTQASSNESSMGVQNPLSESLDDDMISEAAHRISSASADPME